MRIVGVNFVGGRVAGNRPQRANAVFPADLLAFGVRPARIADRHFENAAAALGELDASSGSTSNVELCQRNALQQVRAHHLVAGLHVGQVQVADQVAQ